MNEVPAILWGASFLWAYALILAIAWFRAVGRERMETHVGHWVALMGVMVPPAALCILIVLVSGAVGPAWIAPLLIVVLPSGLVVSLQLEVSRLNETSLRTELTRLGAAFALTLAFAVRA